MTQEELHNYIKRKYPKENECCEWKSFHNLKYAFSGWEGNDIISYVSAILRKDINELLIDKLSESLTLRQKAIKQTIYLA